MERLHLILGIITAVLAGINLILGLLTHREKTSTAKRIALMLLAVSALVVVYLVIAAMHLLNGTTNPAVVPWFICIDVIMILACCLTFRYATVEVPTHFHTDLFESVEQGLILFDGSGKCTMTNSRAEAMLIPELLQNTVCLQSLTEKICMDTADETGTHRLNIPREYLSEEYQHRTVTCTCRQLKNRRGELGGHLFVLTDITSDTDPLTGFSGWDSFRQKFLVDPDFMSNEQIMVGSIEITNLREVNETRGREAGDMAISILSDIMKSEFPSNVSFVRGPDAVLLALCSGMDDEEVRTRLRACKAVYEGPTVAAHASAEAAGSIQNAIQECFRTLRNKKMLDTVSNRNSSISSLIRALHECDSDTESHVQRTRKTGMALAERLKLSDADKSNLNLLCLLHDIGKIGIPLDILNKPGRLSDAEWNIIRSHAKKGYEIAASSREIDSIADLVLHHHERWDGNGYPEGLSGESIPLLSRIISVVDAYDAMTNDRSYRTAMSPEEAQEELKRCAGSQFDPFVVSAFIQMLQEDPDRFAPEKVKTKEAPESRPSPVPVTTVSPVVEAGEENDQPIHTFRMVYTRYIIDEQQKILDVDDEFESITGYSRKDVYERSMYQKDLLPTEDQTNYLAIVSEELQKNAMAYLEHRLVRKDGSVIQVYCFGRQYFDSAERAGKAEIIVADAGNTVAARLMAETARNRAQNRLEHWKNTYRRDSLTGLLTHAAFQNDVESELLSRNSRLLFLMLDLDHFKEYNDSCGHQAGDSLLVQLAQSLEAALRKDDLAGRMGGDEYAAALFFEEEMPDEAITERALQIFDKIHLSLRMKGFQISCSIGAVISSGHDTFTDLYAHADKALYQSKENGRCRLTFYKEN